MATKTQIGAVIGVEGASQYISTMKELARQTKVFKADMDALTSSFDKNSKTIGQLSQEKKLLQKTIDNENQKLAEQEKLMEQINDSVMDGTISVEKWTTAHKEVQVEIDKTTKNVNYLKQQMKELQEQNAFTLMVDAWENTSNKTGEALKKVGGALTKYVTLPIVGGIAASVKVASDFQSAFTGVKKTVEEIIDENGNIVYSYEDLEKELRKIPLETASTYETVMGVAEAAGQLGIVADKIPEFARNIIMLADSTNVSAEDGTVAIAQFMNIMGDAPETIDKFGSSLVALGNTTATDEASILALATRLASAGKLAGLSTPEVLGLSAAMSAVGLTAEAGGTAMSRAMQKITLAVAKGGEDLELFAEVAGTSAEEFADTWRNNPIEAIEQFLVGLGNLDGGSEELLQMLDELGFSGIRESDLLRRLTLDYDGVSEAVKTATGNYQSNTDALEGQNALTKEASKRYEDFASQVSQFKESLKQLGEVLGKEIIPLIQPMVDKLTDIITKFSEMDKGTKDAILGIGGFIAIAGPLIAIAGNVIIWVSKLKAAFGVLKGAEGIAGATEAITGSGGLVSAITDKLMPALGGAEGVGLIGTIGLLGGAYAIAQKGAEQMNTKMYESAEACEYVASRYHWSEEKVNEFGSTWDENGHLVELSTQTITDATNTMVDDVTINVEDLKALVRERAKETAQSVTQSFVDETPQVQSASYQMVKTGIDEIKNGKDETYNYGRELAKNFADGISSGNGLVSWAAQGVAGIVRSFLHFSEPDIGPMSDFHTWMPDMMRGLAEGIEDNLYLVDNAISDVASTLSGGTNVNYGGVVINLNVPQGANGQQILNEIETELANRTIRRRAVFG